MKLTYSSYLLVFLTLTSGSIYAQTGRKNLSGVVQVPTEEIMTKAGEEFTLDIKIAGGTGYTKEFIIQPSSKKMLETINSGTRELNTFAAMPGAPVMRFATFKALKKGTATIVLERKAPGRDQRPVTERIYKVTIK